MEAVCVDITKPKIVYIVGLSQLFVVMDHGLIMILKNSTTV